MERHPYDVLDLKALRCFYAMARCGSLTRGGAELGISDTAVSQRIRALESRLQVKLYEARGGKVQLTADGERTMAFAVELFGRIDAFETELAAGADAGELALSAHDTVLGHLVADGIAAFRTAHPRVRLRLLSRPVQETLRLVAANEVDLGVIPQCRLPRELHFRPLAHYGASLLVAKGDPLARAARADFASVVSEKTLSSHPLLVAEVQLESGLLEETLRHCGLPLEATLELGTVDALKRYVRRGMGIALVSSLCVDEQDQEALEVVPVPEAYGGTTHYGIVTRRGKHRGPLLTSFIDALLGSVPAHAAERL